MFRCLTIATLVTLFASTALGQAQPERKTSRVPNTLALLNQRVPDVSFDEVPFRDVIDWLADTTHATLHVKWQVLEDAGVDPDKPITLKVQDLRFSQVLYMILDQVGGTDLKLAYRAVGNTLILSTEDDLGREMVVKIYDLRDMLVGVARFEAPEMDPGQALSQGGQGGGGSTQLFRGSQGRRDETRVVSGDESPELARLVEVITNTIEPDSWVAQGGRGTIYSFNGMIIVYNTPLVHQAIGGFVEEEGAGP